MTRADMANVTVWTTETTSKREIALQAINQLPPFSPTLNRLMATLAKEDVFLSEIAAIIEMDTVLAGQVLKLVNSALYARCGTINSVGHAVAILGLNKLRNMALTMSVTRMWRQAKTPKSWSQAGFNLHSVATAIMADSLAQRLNVHYPEGAFTAGLLHAMGKLLIAIGLPEHFETIATTGAAGTRTFEEIEQEMIGCMHSELAAAVLDQWKLPAEIQAAALYQHECLPDRGNRMELSRLLYVAHQVVNQLGVSIPVCLAPAPLPVAELFATVGLGAQQEKILETFQAEFDALKSFF
jgi:HD-like signal output (HDOD) protein